MEGDVSKESTYLQHQSQLFGKLSGELRTLVYQFTLGHPNCLTHIILEKVNDHDESAGPRFRHRICEDDETSYPTWQHTCFGQWSRDDRGRAFVRDCPPIASKDGMLSLVLSCRRTYNEALPFLYSLNTFNFQRVGVLGTWKASLSSIQWSSIRHLHIAAMLQQIGRWWVPRVGEGETKKYWLDCCEVLRELPNLRSLRMELTIWYGTYNWEMKHGPCEVYDDFIINVLKPLKEIRVPMFEVELNIPGRPWDGDLKDVFAALDGVGFTWCKKERNVRWLCLRTMMAE